MSRSGGGAGTRGRERDTDGSRCGRAVSISRVGRFRGIRVISVEPIGKYPLPKLLSDYLNIRLRPTLSTRSR